VEAAFAAVAREDFLDPDRDRPCAGATVIAPRCRISVSARRRYGAMMRGFIALMPAPLGVAPEHIAAGEVCGSRPEPTGRLPASLGHPV
jgi:hypothetical protein